MAPTIPSPSRGPPCPTLYPSAPATEDSGRDPVPALPFPVGPLGPQPRSAPPQVPAGEPNVLSGLPELPAADAGFLRASTPAATRSEGLPAQMLPELPVQEPAGRHLPCPSCRSSQASGLVEPPPACRELSRPLRFGTGRWRVRFPNCRP